MLLALLKPQLTFGKQAIVARLGVLPQKPAVAKVVVALNQLDAVSPPQTELVGAAGKELICTCQSATPSSYPKLC